MDRSFLETLGLKVTAAEGVAEAELSLTDQCPENPFTHQTISKVHFTVMGDRLIAVDPPELVGTPPIQLAHLTTRSSLEELVLRAFAETLRQVQRRTAELQVLGLTANVDPATLQLSTELKQGRMVFSISTDRGGNFRISRVRRGTDELSTSSAFTFELSEFRDRASLEDYLFALYGEEPEPHERVEPDLRLAELVNAFGLKVTLPPRAMFEIEAVVRVGQEKFRFTAARVAGKTFRGLLSGATGKLWADRFDVSEFSGLKALVAQVLNVPVDSVEVDT